ncbi:MAG TPA: hypothetical protein VFV87_11365 [Pirellulaceae bacterium]|nr:hypothetical protein [Pirellulaceae bacterium]
MSIRRIAHLVCLLGLVALVQAPPLEAAEPQQVLLPAPLDAVALDPGPFGEKFDVVKIEHFGPGEFTVPPNRVVAEDSLVFTLRAKVAVDKAAMNSLLANPVPRVRFVKQQDGKSLDADARPQGYRLHHDGRWLSARLGPDLKAGESFQVWTHLGKEGAVALKEKGASQAVWEKNHEPAKKP